MKDRGIKKARIKREEKEVNKNRLKIILLEVNGLRRRKKRGEKQRLGK